MTVVNPKSISGINSITMASGSDNLLTIHSNNTTERVRVDSSGNLTATSFSGDGSSLTGVASTENIRTNTNATFLQNINVSGTVTATSYAGSGANLTNLPAANLTGTAAAINGSNITNLTAANLTGALPAISGANLTGINVGVATTVASGITGITTVLNLTNNDHKITVSGITTVDVKGGTEGHTHSLRIINSGITTVGFSTYFLFPSGSSPIIPTTDGTISMISFTVHRQGAVGLATQLLAGASVNFS